MTAFESFDPSRLARVDERSLELARYELVMSCDDRRELVIDELSRRGTAEIGVEAARAGRAKGLSTQQIMSASEEAAVTLAMRLRSPVALKAVTPLARELAARAIQARAAEPERPPRLVSRSPEVREVSDSRPSETAQALPPAVRSIDARVRDAARRGQIKPNDSQTS